MNGRALTRKPLFKVQGQRNFSSYYSPHIHEKHDDKLYDASLSCTLDDAKLMDYNSRESKDINGDLLVQHCPQTEKKSSKPIAGEIAWVAPTVQDTQKSGSHEIKIPGKQRQSRGRGNPQTKGALPPEGGAKAEGKGKTSPKLRASAQKTSRRITTATSKAVKDNPRQSSAVKDEVTKGKVCQERKTCCETKEIWQGTGARPKNRSVVAKTTRSKSDLGCREFVGSKQQQISASVAATGARPKNKSVVAKTTRSKSDLGCREFVGSKQQQISASVAATGARPKNKSVVAKTTRSKPDLGRREFVGSKRQQTSASVAARGKDGGGQVQKRGRDREVTQRTWREHEGTERVVQHCPQTEKKSSKPIAGEIAWVAPTVQDTQKSGSHEIKILGTQRQSRGRGNPQTKGALPPEGGAKAEGKGKTSPKLRASAQKTSRRITTATSKAVKDNPRQSSAVKDEVTKGKVCQERKTCCETKEICRGTGARPKNKSVVAKTTRSKSDLGCREFVGSKQQQISASVAATGARPKNKSVVAKTTRSKPDLGRREFVSSKRQQTSASVAARGKDGGGQVQKRGRDREVTQRTWREHEGTERVVQHCPQTEKKSSKPIAGEIAWVAPTVQDTQKSGSHEIKILGTQRQSRGRGNPQTKGALPPEGGAKAEGKGKTSPKLRASAQKTSRRITTATSKAVKDNPRQSSAVKDEVTKGKVCQERKTCWETKEICRGTGARPKNKSVVAKTTRSKSDLGCREFVGSKQQQISASVAATGARPKNKSVVAKTTRSKPDLGRREFVSSKRQQTSASVAARGKDGGGQVQKRGRDREVTQRTWSRPGAEIDSKTLDEVPNRPFLDVFTRKVSLLKDDIQRNSSLVNEVIPKLLEQVRNIDPLFTVDTLNTGSYYEKLKVCRPIEFDVMVVLEAWQVSQHFEIVCHTRGDCLGFAQLKYQDWKERAREWKDYLTSDGKFLSPAKIRKRFLDLLYQSIKNKNLTKELPQQVHSLRVDANGPAAKVMINEKIDVDVVISLEVIGWPGSANGWGDHASRSTWPKRDDVEKIKIKKKRYHLVAKDVESTAEQAAEQPLHRRCNWRISFSEAEKSLLLPASDSADKEYYRIVKYIFEAHREELRPLCSYHLKTLFFHQRKSSAGKVECSRSTVGKNVVKFFYNLTDHVKEGSLRHFFVERQNLLSAMPKSARDKIVGALEQILWNLVNEPHDFLAELHVN